MSTSSFVQRTLAIIGMCVMSAGAVLVGAVTTGSPAVADPDVPSIGCASAGFAYVCDSPIHPDNTFDRCRISRPIFAPRELYIPPVKTCWVVDMAGSPNFGVGFPQHHIAN